MQSCFLFAHCHKNKKGWYLHWQNILAPNPQGKNPLNYDGSSSQNLFVS